MLSLTEMGLSFETKELGNGFNCKAIVHTPGKGVNRATSYR